MLSPVAAGEIATVVTNLVMSTRPRDLSVPPSPLRLKRWERPAPDQYRDLFRRVGARWLWYSRLQKSDEALVAATHRIETEVHVAFDAQDRHAGFAELTWPQRDWCAIDFLGLVPEWIGRGQGRWLLANTLALAWRPDVAFVRVNTCTLDHPAALPNYLRAGFRVRSRELETFPDPRLSGALPPDAAPQTPVASAGGTDAGAPPPAS